jgi:hypothetical protein
MDAETREALGEIKVSMARIEERLSAIAEVKPRVDALEKSKWHAHGAAAALAALFSWIGIKWSGGHQ